MEDNSDVVEIRYANCKMGGGVREWPVSGQLGRLQYPDGPYVSRELCADGRSRTRGSGLTPGREIGQACDWHALVTGTNPVQANTTSVRI